MGYTFCARLEQIENIFFGCKNLKMKNIIQRLLNYAMESQLEMQRIIKMRHRLLPTTTMHSVHLGAPTIKTQQPMQLDLAKMQWHKCCYKQWELIRIKISLPMQIQQVMMR